MTRRLPRKSLVTAAAQRRSLDAGILATAVHPARSKSDAVVAENLAVTTKRVSAQARIRGKAFVSLTASLAIAISPKRRFGSVAAGLDSGSLRSEELDCLLAARADPQFRHGLYNQLSDRFDCSEVDSATFSRIAGGREPRESGIVVVTPPP